MSVNSDQQAGDSATQIGAVRGSVIQDIHQRLGFWGFLAASVVTLGVAGFAGVLVDTLWKNAHSAEPSGFPVSGASQPSGDGRTVNASISYQVLAGAAPPADRAPAFNAGLQHAQDLNQAAQIMQYVNGVEMQAVATRDPWLAASVFAGAPLQAFVDQIGQLTALGLTRQEVLEGGSVHDVRVVESTPWGVVIEIDTCEYWSSITWDRTGSIVENVPRHAVPQTVTLEMAAGQMHVIDVDFDIGFPGCW